MSIVCENVHVLGYYVFPFHFIFDIKSLIILYANGKTTDRTQHRVASDCRPYLKLPRQALKGKKKIKTELHGRTRECCNRIIMPKGSGNLRITCFNLMNEPNKQSQTK